MYSQFNFNNRSGNSKFGKYASNYSFSGNGGSGSRYVPIAMMAVILTAIAVILIVVGTNMGKTEQPQEPEHGGYVAGEEEKQESGRQNGGENTGGEGEKQQPQTVQPSRAEQIMAEMTLEDKIGELLLVRSNGLSNAEFAELAARCHAGGVVLFADDINEKDASQLTADIAALQTACGGRLLVCVDEEGGTVVRVSRNELLRPTKFQSPQSVFEQGGMEAIVDDAAEKSEFLAGFGFNVNFAPVADVVTDSNGFLYKRAFGQGAEETAEYVKNVVSTMKACGMGCTIKHFPGYGNAYGDTHNGIVVVGTSKKEILNSELTPFKAGIAAGADSVMVTHSIMTELDPDRPSSLSPATISLLREELGFDGVVISDGLDMGAILQYSGGKDVCVTAFLAGNDLLCTPTDADIAFDALYKAVEDGTISPERLDESVKRIVEWKIGLGLYD